MSETEVLGNRKILDDKDGEELHHKKWEENAETRTEESKNPNQTKPKKPLKHTN